MKKFLMTIAAAFIAVSMNAQNQMWVGGSLGYSTSSYDGNSTRSSFSIIPEFGVQLDENLGVGVEIGYRSTTTKGTPDLTDSKFTFAPYARYTAMKFGAVNLFVDGQFSYYTGNDQVNVNGTATDAKYNGWGVAVKPGIAYNVTNELSLVAKLGDVIGYYSSKPDGGKATTTLNLINLSNAIQFGVYYNF